MEAGGESAGGGCWGEGGRLIDGENGRWRMGKSELRRELGIVKLYVFLWRMPADPCPAATCFYDVGVIHIQSNHGSPSHRSQADDFAAILAPAKVLAPLLSAWMEQQYAFACQGVLGLSLRTLELVAGMTRQTQVFPHRLAAGRFRYDMVNYQTCSRNGGEGVTIGALVTEFGHHALAKRARNVRSGHSGLCHSSREGMRCPRHFNSM